MSDNLNGDRAFVVPALPQTAAGLIAQRKTSLRIKSLNDEVEELHLQVWDSDPKYRALFDPLWREDTVEGTFIADDITKAMVIRAAAKEKGLLLAANAKLASIVHSLHVVESRYNQSRRQRQNVIRGEHVMRTPPSPRENDNNDC